MRTPHVIALSLPLLAASHAAAGDYFWTNPAGGAWFQGANWLGGAQPSAFFADVIIDEPGEYTIDIAGQCVSYPVNADTLSVLAPDATLRIGGWSCGAPSSARGIELRISESLRNNARIQLHEGALGAPSLRLHTAAGQPATLAGFGVVSLANGAVTGEGRQLAGHTILGAGSVSLAHNEGFITASPRTDLLGAQHTTLDLDVGINTGPLSAEPDATLSLAATLNEADIAAQPGGTIHLREVHNAPGAVISAAGGALVVDGPLTGGALHNTLLGSASISAVGDVVLVGEFTASGRALAPGFSNNATITVPDRYELPGGSQIDGAGTILLHDGAQLVAVDPGLPVMLKPAQTVSGTGALVGPFSIMGTLSPGTPTEAGELTLTDAVTLHPTTEILIDVLSPEDYDRVVASPASPMMPLDGRVSLRFLGHTPCLGEEFTVLQTSGPYTGQFANLDTPNLDAAYAIALEYRAAAVVARVTSAACPADLAEPCGQLDYSDVIAFLTAFAAASPSADLAQPTGQFDFSDILAFISAFAAGCP